jgi:hypothetical protein
MTTFSVAPADETSREIDTRLGEEPMEPVGAARVPLDNVLDAETHRGRSVQCDFSTEGPKKADEPPSMKFYRPGDPGHQSVRPITSKFRQKYSALESLSRLENERVRVSCPSASCCKPTVLTVAYSSTTDCSIMKDLVLVGSIALSLKIVNQV